MSYGEFLVQWYNLIFLAAGALGLFLALTGRSRERDPFPPAAAALAVSLAGLTLNGAVHDLGLGDPADHFWWVIPASLLLGGGASRLLTWARDRWFPPIRGVRWNPGDRVGAEARVVSATVTGEHGSGRAQWQDRDGVLTLVRCHTDGGTMNFGARVRLERWNEEAESYLVAYRSE